MELDTSVSGAPGIVPGADTADPGGIFLDPSCIAESAQASASRGERGWSPGVDTKGWLSRSRGGCLAILPQAKVLIVNGYIGLNSLSRQRLSLILGWLSPGVGFKGALHAHVLSKIFCIPADTISYIWKTVRASGYRVTTQGRRTDLELPEQGCSEATVLDDLELPDLVEADGNPRETASGALNADQQAQALRNLVRLALHNAVRGRPHSDFVYDVNQMALAGGKVGNKYHTADFAVACEKFANDDLEKVTVQSLQIILPGLGVKSDLELIGDGGSLGKYYSRGGDSVLIIGIVASTKHAPYSHVYFIGSVNQEADERAEALAARFEDAVDKMGMPWGDLKSRWACFCGDGAYVGGGPNAKHNGANAVFESMWDKMKRPRRCIWDLFHCIDKAGSNALRSALPEDFLQLTKDLEHLFGLGQGRHLDRCIASYLGVKFLSCQTACGTRKVVYLSGVPERYIHKFKRFYLGLLLRMNRALDQRGSSNHSFKKLKELGERLADTSLLVFAMGLGPHLQRSIVPLALLGQDITALPWERLKLARATQKKIRTDEASLDNLSVITRMYALLFPYLGKRDLVPWWTANVISRAGRRFPALYAATHTILTSGTYQGCDLTIAMPKRPERTAYSHPVCQCGTRPQLQPGTSLLTCMGGDIRDTCYLPESVFSGKCVQKGNGGEGTPLESEALRLQGFLAAWNVSELPGILHAPWPLGLLHRFLDSFRAS